MILGPIDVGWVWTEGPAPPASTATFYRQIHHRCGFKSLTTQGVVKWMELGSLLLGVLCL